ncbi:MAG: hypothetical protein ACN4GK_13245 [Acidimicrobiia bacterium]
MMATEYQLRQYVVEDGKWDEFLGIFPEVVQVRKEVGFDVVGVWTVQDERRFIWIVSTDHPDGIEGASEVYYHSPGRKAITPEPATLLSEISTTTMAALQGI